MNKYINFCYIGKRIINLSANKPHSLLTRVLLSILINAFCLLLPYAASGPFAGEIAVIKSKNIEPYNLSLEGLREVVKVRVKVYNMDGKLEKGPIIIKNIQSNKPDLILGLGAMAASTASQNVKDTPVVYSMVADPKRYKISGENVTGIKLDIPLEQQFLTYRKILPGVKKIGVIFSSDRSARVVDKARSLLEGMNVELVSERISSPKDIPPAVGKILSDVDALWLVFDSVVTASPRIVQEVIIFSALRKRIPVIGFNKWSVTAGALFSFFSEYKDIGRQTGRIVNRILQGVAPSAIPVESPQKIVVFFNEKVIARVGSKVNLNIPDNAFIWEGE